MLSKNNHKDNFWYKVLIVVSILLFAQVIGPFIKEGLFLGHDSQLHTIYLKKFDTTFRDGQFPVRWIDWFKVGLNQPLFNFYQPGVYYLYLIPRFLGVGYVESLDVLVISLWLISALLMFLFVRRHFGTLPAILASYLYTLAPYHILDILIRAAMPEFTALAFIPGVFWGIKGYFDTKKPFYLSLTALFVALTTVSHPPTIIMFSLLIIAYIIYNFFVFKTIRYTLYAISSVLLGFGLISFFILPAYFEQGYIQTIFLHTGYYDYHHHFVCWPQLFSTFWGNGTSTSECTDGLSLQLGVAHWIVVGLTLIILIFRSRFRKFASKYLKFIDFENLNSKDYILTIIFVSVLAVVLYITLYIALPVWDTLPYIPYIQYSWRFLAVAIFVSSFLAAPVLYSFRNDKTRMVMFGVLMLLTTGLYSNYLKPIAYGAKNEIQFGEEILHPALNIKNFDPEPGYMPRWTQILPGENDRPYDEVKFLSGNVTVNSSKRQATSKEYTLTASTAALARFYVHYYPGWKVYLDGKEVKPNYDNIYGFMEVNLPANTKKVVLKFENTALRTAADVLSLIFILFSLLIAFLPASLFKKLRFRG